MKLLIGTHTDAYDTCGCEYAIVDMDSELAKLLLRNIALVNALHDANDSVCCVEFFMPGLVKYFNPEESIYDIQTDDNQLADGIWNADAMDNIGDPSPTDCDRLAINADRSGSHGPTLFFTTIPHNTSILVETDIIPESIIKKIAGE